jgi:hypothetical protein
MIAIFCFMYVLPSHPGSERYSSLLSPERNYSALFLLLFHQDPLARAFFGAETASLAVFIIREEHAALVLADAPLGADGPAHAALGALLGKKPWFEHAP